jgi:hypothetical protein
LAITTGLIAPQGGNYHVQGCELFKESLLGAISCRQHIDRKIKVSRTDEEIGLKVMKQVCFGVNTPRDKVIKIGII